MICIFIILALIGLDQLVKFWTVMHFAAPPSTNLYVTPDPAIPFLPGLVELTRVHNYGAAWSSFSGMRWLLIVLTSAVMVGLAALLVKKIVRHPVGLTGLTLVLAGGVGNLIDRVRLGYVVDMFHFEFWPSYPVFNIADIFVVAGVIICLLYYFFFYEKYDAPKKKDGAKKEG